MAVLRLGDPSLDPSPSGCTPVTQEKVDEIQAHAAQRFGELISEISVTRSAVGVSAGAGGPGSPWVEKDRNVFDVRDYKLSDLGVKPTTARWKSGVVASKGLSTPSGHPGRGPAGS